MSLSAGYIAIYIERERQRERNIKQCALSVITTTALGKFITLAHDIRLDIVGTTERKSAQQAKEGA